MRGLFSKLGLAVYKKTVAVDDSSVIKSISYNRKNKSLTVTFNNDSVYVYGGVQPSAMREFNSAPSKGKFFVENIRNNKEYPYRLVSQ